MIINGSIRFFKSFERTENQFIEKSTAFSRFDIFDMRTIKLRRESGIRYHPLD